MGASEPNPGSTSTVAWSTDLGQAPVGSPWIAGDLILVPTQAGQLHAFDTQEGAPCWSKTFPHAQVGGLTSTEQGLILVATYGTDLLRGQGELVALDGEGVERWRWSPGVHRVSAPAVAGEVVCLNVNSEVFVTLEAASGRERTRLELAASASPSVPALIDGIAYIPCRGPHLLAATLEGTQRWHAHFRTEPGAWLDKTPVAIGNRLFAVLSSGAVLALYLDDGSPAWRRDVGSPGKPLSPPATDGSRLYVGARDGLHALDPQEGGELWRLATGRGIVAAPVTADGVVYAACHDHRLYALEAESGRELWHVELERRIDVSPALSGDRVLAMDRGGRLLAVEWRLSAARYASSRCSTEATVAHRLRREPAGAARIDRDSLGQPLRAAGRCEEAGDAERAAALYEQQGAWAEALACYLILSERHAAVQPPAPAASSPIGVRVSGQRIVRDTLHDLLVERLSLEDLRQLCFDLEIDYENLRGEEKPARARALILYLERRDRLAELVRVGQEQRPDVAWEDALQPTDASSCLAPDPALGGPYGRKIAELAIRLGQWERAGQAWAALGEFRFAAEAFLRAARRAEQDASHDETHLADLWAAAEACCEEAFDEDRALACRRQVARYRHLPCLEVRVERPETMIRGQYAPIQLVLYNAGGGAARQVVVHHTLSDFTGDLSETKAILGLAPGQALRKELAIRPMASGPVPLRIAADYADAEGRSYQATCRTLVEVLEPD